MGDLAWSNPGSFGHVWPVHQSQFVMIVGLFGSAQISFIDRFQTPPRVHVTGTGSPGPDDVPDAEQPGTMLGWSRRLPAWARKSLQRSGIRVGSGSPLGSTRSSSTRISLSCPGWFAQSAISRSMSLSRTSVEVADPWKFQ